MQPNITFLTDLTIALTSAVFGGWLARRFGINSIVGFLLAGIIIGPFTPGYVAESQTLASLAELGLIFLLFSIGLGFSLEDIRSIGLFPFIASLVTIGLFVLGFWGIAAVFHLPHPWTLGIVATVSSTAIGVTLLRQWKLETQRSGEFALALLIVQDLASVVLLVVTATPAQSLSFVGILFPMMKAIGFVAAALILGRTALHAAVTRILRNSPTETLFGAFAALALVAAWIAHLAGLSFDFGAFVAGMVVSEATGSRMVQAIVAPFRALFTALFFVAIGTLLDPRIVLHEWQTVLTIGISFLILRFLAWGIVNRCAGFALPTAMLMAAAMVPLGEFNLVLSNAATTAHRLTAMESNVLLGITFLSIIATTVSAPALERLLATRAPKPVPLEGYIARTTDAVIIGFGRVGKTTANALARCGITLAILEHDRSMVAQAQAEGFEAIVGDANDPSALDAVISAQTRVIIAATPDSQTNASVLHRYADRSETTIIVRARQLKDITYLRERGATNILIPEIEGALAFASVALKGLSISDEQAQREIARERLAMETYV